MRASSLGVGPDQPRGRHGQPASPQCPTPETAVDREPLAAAPPRSGNSLDEDVAALLNRFELVVSSDGREYATERSARNPITYLVGSNGFIKACQRMTFERTGRVLRSDHLKGLVDVLSGIAQNSGTRAEVWTRVGMNEGNIYLDLADNQGRVVEVNKDTWRIIESPPVRFWRPSSMRPLCVPVPGQDGLSAITNVLSRLDPRGQRLVVAFAIGSLYPHGPYPILELWGSPGSGKTSTAAIVQSWIDPCVAAAAGVPKDAQDLLIAAQQGWLYSLDNVSSIPPGVADALCRLSTGGALRVRRLYTNGDEFVISVQRPVMITSVDPVLRRADLRDRSVPIECPRIASSARRPHQEVMSEAASLAPEILGTLLGAVSASLRDGFELKPTSLPRMADLALRVMAASKVFGWREDQFLRDIDVEHSEGHQDVLAECPVAVALITFFGDRRRWEGTATHLRDVLTARVGDRVLRDRSWPADPAAFSRRLNQIAPHLLAVGLRVTKGRNQGQNRLRTLVIERIGGEE